METILERLIELSDITGAVLVGKDGLIVTGTLHSEDEEVIGAMSAAAFGSIAGFVTQMSGGDMRHVTIETQSSVIHFEEISDLILIVTTSPASNVGRVRIEMKKARQQIVQLVASY